jgi:signal transduction histidine kinase
MGIGMDAAYVTGMERLVAVVQELSLARDLDTIMQIVRKAARELTGADGATFVLRDNGNCYYADEDAIEPLWKGKRFPLEACISGWAMLHREPVAIEDIYKDARIPHDAYRPTFVKSLVMVPIRQIDPVGSIGNYWARPHKPTEQQIRLLQALADSTSIAMQNVELLSTLEARVAERTSQLEAANRELEAFSYAVSHDLRSPLRSINAFGEMLLEDHGDVLGAGKHNVDRMRASAQRMTGLVEALLELSRVKRAPIQRAELDVSHQARELVDELCAIDPDRSVEISIADAITASGDARLVRVVMQNLLANAWKYTSKLPSARIEVGRKDDAIFVRDNGAGFDATRADKLFVPFHRLHSANEFDGSGVGLATAQRVIDRHGGRIWAESAPNEGATFYFTLGSAA